MENGRASGIDGLLSEFFWAVIGQDVLDVLRDSIRRGELPLSCRRAVLTLLPKKGDLTHLKNWRPVSLLCTDCKLLSKALASRLTKVMEQLIHQDQTYCVPDRSIFNNVYLIRDILDVSKLLGLKTGLIFLDQEKAFDRVEHEYLWKVLEAFGFNPGFVAMISMLYCEIESVLKILSSSKVNWTKSEAILVGEWGGGQPSLLGGLAWKRGGFKYLGVYLGTNEFLNKKLGRFCRAREGQTEQVEAAGPEDVLQGVNAGHQQPHRIVPLAQASMRRSTAEPASEHPGPVGGLLLGRSTLDSTERSPPAERGRRAGAGPAI
ncbi:hypothetical protein QTP86_008680 [Hemibagrus guttatus]|nr:hypothetical protein QTP86_008680 [Hemibagrus guttatus]